MEVTLKKSVESKIRANARRGARALDAIGKKTGKKWYASNYLSLQKLEMTNSCLCVWGQLRCTTLADTDEFNEKDSCYNGTGTPGYVPNYDKNDEGECHVDPIAQQSWWSLSDEDKKIHEAVAAEEWRILQDEWETQIRLRRRAANVTAAPMKAEA